MERIKEIKNALSNGSALTKSDKDYIRKMYLKYLGDVLKTSPKCNNCWSEAIDAIIIISKRQNIHMSAGKIIEFEGIKYTHSNITDEIALKIMSESPELKIYFDAKCK